MRNSLGDQGYWDIHNHILPGVDDGASCFTDALSMVQEEYRQGIRNLVLTPHYRPGMFHISSAVRAKEFEKFRRKIQDVLPDMNLYLGCENYVHDKILRQIEDPDCRMAGQCVVLLEFSTKCSYEYMEKQVQVICGQNILPILAHVERYLCLREDVNLVKKLISLGSWIQINADSLTTRRFSPEHRFVTKLMNCNMVHFIASDAHDNDYRPVRMDSCIQLVQKKYGSDRAEQIFMKNPEKCFLHNNEPE